MVGDEKAAEFAALEAALRDELAPDGALQGLLAGRIARAAWRLERAERIEAELFAREMGGRNLGLALIRDGNGARAFDTLLRYRGTALAELWRALRLLKALQAEQARAPEERAVAPAPALPAPESSAREEPIEPEAQGNPERMAPAPAAHEPEAAPKARADGAVPGKPVDAAPGRHVPARPHPARLASVCDAAAAPVLPQVAADAVRARPIEPEVDGIPDETPPMPGAETQPPGVDDASPLIR